jgi:protein-S-isoprenylcysteine O-methyltransferase Ste14
MASPTLTTGSKAATAEGIARWAIPLALGSLWTFLPALLTNVLLVVRTGLEDRTLRAELPGYREYAAVVRYRLFPGVW